MARIIDRTWEDCPNCNNQKLVSSKLCRTCTLKGRTGANHPNYKGGSPVCQCGGPKDYNATLCRTCRMNQHPYAGLTPAERQRVFRRTPTGQAHVRRMNLRKFGLTPEQYDKILEEQEGRCAACRQEETHRNQFGVVRLAVDHDHSTGNIRGLLCARCNRALGLLGDSVERLKGLLAYRKRW